MDHVFWLSGSACAGKTSVARHLAARHGLTLYSCDDHFEEHRLRADPARHPHFCRLMDVPMEELLTLPADIQAEEILLFHQDELGMVLEDLRELPGPVLAEGAGLLPERIAAVCPDPGRALWLVSTPCFRRQAYPQRGPFVQEILGRCADPEEAFSRWMERDDRIARRLEEEARHLGLGVVGVDGGQGVEEVARRVAERLWP